MLAASLAYIINSAVIIVYIIFVDNKMVWPRELIYWPWFIYSIHFYLHHYFDGLQNTTRNIGRIYLLNLYGLNYNKSQATKIQELLVPNSMLPRLLVWQAAHVLSFTTILFYQGWGTAIAVEICILVVPIFIPLNYRHHLVNVANYLNALTPASSFEFLSNEISHIDLKKLIERAIDERLNPQKWWGKELNSILHEQDDT
ncbi:MAG: hypothetical protein H8D23_16260 [Candidatus Brocadiales bacterium]|nr:hypothetical protein [Candidatus Brocadiales bacterium]